MPNYNLNALGDNEFERLFQSLLKKVVGVGTITFGLGPDGGREATYRGKSNYRTHKGKLPSGYWIFQAKFHDTTNVSNPQKIILQDLRKELIKITSLYKLQCDNYVMGTNVSLSSVHNKGTLDRIEVIAQKFRNRIPNIFVWGYDEICRYIDNYADIRRAYVHLITPGDVLSRFLSENIDRHFTNLKKNVIAPILYYLDVYPNQLPTIDKITSNLSSYPPGMSNNFDPILVDDFVENHYPYIRILWDKMCDLNSRVDEKKVRISKIVDKNLRNALKREPYSYLDQQDKYYRFCYEEFENTLFESILDGHVPCTKIYEDPAQTGRIKFIHRNIYMLNEGDDSQDTISKLRILCSRLAYNKSIKLQLDGIDGYKALNEERKEYLVIFKRELGKINNSESLQVLKNDEYQKCQLL